MKKIYVTILVLVSLFFGASAFANVDINGYQYILVPDSNDDPYNCVIIIREAATKKGFIVIADENSIDESELHKVCFVECNLSFYGQISASVFLQVVDFLTGTPIVQAKSSGGWSFYREKNVEQVINTAFSKIKYLGFNEQANLNNLRILFKDRPIVSIDEEEFRKSSFTNPIEGIWVHDQNKYSIAIIQDSERKYGDFVGVILSSSNPIWKKGEIKIELTRTSVNSVYIGNYYMGNKSKLGTTITIEGSTMVINIKLPDGNNNTFTFFKTFPIVDSSNHRDSSNFIGTGTGFLISIDGYVATNFHVVKNATEISVEFPAKNRKYVAVTVLKDSKNDLAILKLKDFSASVIGLTHLPYVLEKSQKITLGEKIFTIGYPLENIMGQNPKYTEGVVSSKTGIQDDPGSFQITASVQPGSSGSPVFNSKGNIIGVVVATLDPIASETLPQNVNYAIKIDYLNTLIDMLPDPIITRRVINLNPEIISQYVVLVKAK